MRAGTERESRMTVLRVFVLAASVLLAYPVQAAGNVYTGLGVYKPTVNRWSTAVQSASFSSDSWIWSLGKVDKKHKNKSRDTILMVPEKSIPDDITLVVWFHGCSGFSQRTFSKRIVPQIESIVADGHSVAIAIPEMPWSINTSTKCSRQGRVWNKSGELRAYVQDLREHLEAWAIIKHKKTLGSVRLVFLGHSAGGSALMSAAKGGGLCRLNPESIIWSDASYGYWLDTAWKSCIKDANTELHVLVRRWDKPHKNAQRLQRAWKRIRNSSSANVNVHYYVLDRKLWKHSDIGDNVFDITKLFPPGC